MIDHRGDLAKLYTVAQTAEYLQVSQKSVRRWIQSGVLPSLRIGRCIRIAENAIAKYISDHNNK